MNNTLRRFEILLPLRFNDGRSVPDQLVGQTLRELRQRFNAISAETQVIRGYWQHEGEEFRDDLVRVSWTLPTRSRITHILWISKNNLKLRFQQLDVWMTTYSIGVI